MTGYVRADGPNNIADGNIINAADLDGEFDAVVAAFNATTGHTHDGTAAEGAPITKLGPVQDVVVSSGNITPKITNIVDIGSSSLKFKDVYLTGTVNAASLTASKAVFTDGSKGLVSNEITGTGNVVMSTSPTLVTPALGTPSSVTLTNATGLPVATGISGLGSGIATFLATPSSANLAATVTDETGSGSLVFSNSPTLVTPTLGTPASATLTNATGLPVSTGISGLGTGVATALAVNTGSAGAVVLFNGALGTPSSGTVTNLTGTASININGTVGATTANTGAFTTLTTTADSSFAAPVVIEGTTTSAALRITQLGTGNALLVEDSANPDATPFVIDASGRVISGHTSSLAIGSDTSNIQTNAGSSTNNGYGTTNWTGSTGSSNFNFAKSRSTAIGTPSIVLSGDSLGKTKFYGDDGVGFIEAARIEAAVDGTPGTNDMPGRLVFSTTADGASSPTTRLIIYSDGSIQAGASQAPSYNLRVGRNISGAASGGNFYASGTVQSDVTSNGYGFLSEIKTAAASFVLNSAHGFRATQGAIGAGSSITNQYGFNADSTLTGATNNYGFYGNIASGTGRYNLYMNGTADNYMAGKTRVGTAAAPTVSFEVGATDAMLLPKGTSAQQPTGVAGYLRFNTDTTQFEGYNGTAWSSVGGAAIVNDTSTTSNLYPLFAGATSGTALTIYTGNANLLYKPSTGELQSRVPVASNGIVVNSLTVATSYTIAAGYSGASAGPITVASGAVVTVAGGSRWVIS